jgi:hypothetical protein
MASLGLTVARVEKQVIVTAPGIQGPPGIQGEVGDTGETGPIGPQGNSISIKGTLAAGAWSAPASPTIGDIWIAGGVITGAVTAVLGDGIQWTGTLWVNVGQVRGPIGLTGNSCIIRGTLSAGAWSAPVSPVAGDAWIAGGVITGAVTAVLGDGIVFNGTTWNNVGQLRGPVGPSGSVNGTAGSIPQFSTTTAVVDSKIKEVSTNIYEQSNSTSAQKFRVSGTKTDSSNYRGVEISDTTAGAGKIDATGLGTGATGNTLDLAAGGVSGLRINSAGGIEGPLGTITRTHAGDAGCILPSATSGSRVDATLVRHTIGTGDFAIGIAVDAASANDIFTVQVMPGIGKVW